MKSTEPELFVYMSPRRSGSTLLMNILAHHPDVGVTSRIISRGIPKADGFEPDYSIFGTPYSDKQHPIIEMAHSKGKKVVLLKEEKGDSLQRGTEEVNECNFHVFPDDMTLVKSKPFFLFRDPVRTFDGWKEKGWFDLESFLVSYKSVFAAYKRAQKLFPDTFSVTYELLTRDSKTSQRIVQKICTHLGVPFESKILDMPDAFGTHFLFSSKREEDIYNGNPKGLFSDIISARGRGISYNIKPHGNVTKEELDRINTELGPIYKEIQRDAELMLSTVPARSFVEKVGGPANKHLSIGERRAIKSWEGIIDDLVYDGRQRKSSVFPKQFFG